MEVSRQTDSNRWDARLREAGGHPLQSWAWGSLKEQFGWQPYRLWAGDGAAAAQLLIRPLRGIAAAYVPRGPRWSGDRRTDAALLAAIERLSRTKRAAFLRLEPDVIEGGEHDGPVRELLSDSRFRLVERTLQPRSSIVLDIARPDEELLAGFSKGHRADVRRAEREGVQVRPAASEADVDLLHEMMRATQRRKDFGIHTPGYYRAAWRLFGDDAHLLLAESEGVVVAASLVLAVGRQALYLAAGSTRRGLELRASHLLQWHAMRWAREHGAGSYDLWGIPDARARLELLGAGDRSGASAQLATLEQQAAADPLDSVFRFKKGWGGRVVRGLPAFDRVYFAPAYWFWLWRRSEA